MTTLNGNGHAVPAAQPRPARTRRTAHSDEALLAELIEHDATLAELAARHEAGLAGVARWLGSARVQKLIAALRRAFDGQAQLTVSRNRADAARVLGELARDTESRETARKACVDLLRMLPVPPVADAQPGRPPAGDEARPPEESIARRVLEAFGARSAPDAHAPDAQGGAL